jgi:hypothetical protein
MWASQKLKENTTINWQAAAAVSGGGGEPRSKMFFLSLCTSRRTLFVAIQLGVKNKIKTLTLNSLTLTRPRTCTCRIAEPGCNVVHT